jgi:hypothetical protein
VPCLARPALQNVSPAGVDLHARRRGRAGLSRVRRPVPPQGRCCPSRIRTSASASRARCPASWTNGHRTGVAGCSRSRDRTWAHGSKVRRAASYTNRECACPHQDLNLDWPRPERGASASWATGASPSPGRAGWGRWSRTWELNPVTPGYETGARPGELVRRVGSRAAPGSRTPTGLVLDQVPLPVGLEPRDGVPGARAAVVVEVVGAGAPRPEAKPSTPKGPPSGPGGEPGPPRVARPGVEPGSPG